jgi:hypothetical protein
MESSRLIAIWDKLAGSVSLLIFIAIVPMLNSCERCGLIIDPASVHLKLIGNSWYENIRYSDAIDAFYAIGRAPSVIA